MEDALQAYDSGRVHGFAGRRDEAKVTDPNTGADYQIGLADGQVTLFEVQLLAAVRRAMDSDDGVR
ncbi:hypothetical protein ACWKSP_15135 [Micromonosporaceae bacterium Da 78-11]